MTWAEGGRGRAPLLLPCLPPSAGEGCCSRPWIREEVSRLPAGDLSILPARARLCPPKLCPRRALRTTTGALLLWLHFHDIPPRSLRDTRCWPGLGAAAPPRTAPGSSAGCLCRGACLCPRGTAGYLALPQPRRRSAEMESARLRPWSPGQRQAAPARHRAPEKRGAAALPAGDLRAPGAGREGARTSPAAHPACPASAGSGLRVPGHEQGHRPFPSQTRNIKATRTWTDLHR